MRHVSRAAPLGLALALGLAACGTIRESEAEEKVAHTLREVTGRPYAVDCPGGQKRERGVRFFCTATAPSGFRSRLTVQIIADDGTFVVSRVPVDPRRLEQDLLRTLRARGVQGRAARCPAGRPTRRGERITCTAAGREVEVTILDDTGRFRITRIGEPAR